MGFGGFGLERFKPTLVSFLDCERKTYSFRFL